LQPLGMRTGYHNHTIEFTPMDGELPWDTFFGNTRKDVVMQFDVGNAMHGGADAAPYLERYPGRATTVHVKEYSINNDKALIGEGDVPWGRIFDLCETIGGTEWYIVEQESYAYPPMECVDRCLQNLRAMGK
ncbi:MAG TPA: sugar phosphate isomerase/epimerase, partial [Roseiflexaceae bacterium]|nr:sugar phosphate isomerase/epimerase [Roseiflexaceae bacterium]